MSKGKKNNKSISLEQTICPKCGLYNDPIFTFCESCGTRLMKPIERDPYVKIDQAMNEISDYDEESDYKTEVKVNKKSDRWFNIFVGIMIVVGISFYFDWPNDVIDFAKGDEGAPRVQEEQTDVVSTEQYPEVQEHENQDDSAESSIKVMDASAIEIISADWDHDSSRTIDGQYFVDAILRVKNNGDEPLVKIRFRVPNIDKTHEAIGFVPAGKKGTMVATLGMKSRYNKPKLEEYAIEEGYANSTLQDYAMPHGKFIKRHGDNNDYYDIRISNDNDNGVSKDSIVVAVFLKDGRIKESDATGKIASEIPANSHDWVQTDAFFNPNFYHFEGNEDRYRVIVIDKEKLLGESATKEAAQ